MAGWDVDVIVVGAGHAGAEAALASARLGAETLLVTLDINSACKMSCNPAIGGIAKGQMVREVDALGGEMGLAIDATGIHFRMLNTRKGPAMHSPRAQADKDAYSQYFRRVLEATNGLHLLHDEVTALLVEQEMVKGVRLRSGVSYFAPAVVLTTGTFLGGKIYIGDEVFGGGRTGEIASDELSRSLKTLGLELGRLKTGTPPRLLGSSIDFTTMRIQEPDPEPTPFSFRTAGLSRPQVPCYVTRTTERTRGVILANLDRSPLFSGRIAGVGPRYCPSIEDKIVRFPDHPTHTVFVEPEGLDNEEWYPNGISSSLPVDVQTEIVHSIAGLEQAQITRWAYAVEYDFVRTHQLTRSMECKLVAGLFLAGQINGTSGYEEAAGQGIIAGINAARKTKGKPPVILPRRSSYVGVLIDDLVTRDINEPYRMFTSRAENRLELRHDNADRRLLGISREIGLLPADVLEAFAAKGRAIEAALKTLAEHRYQGRPLVTLLRRPDLDGEPEPVREVLDALGLSPCERRQVACDARYEGYLKRQHACIEGMEHWETRSIPGDLDYLAIHGLRTESRNKLAKARPHTLADALRITGVTPADVQVIEIHLRRCMEGSRT